MNEFSQSLRPLQAFLAKHHPVLFICLMAIVLSAAIYSLYDVSRQAEADPSSVTSSTITSFDKKTVDMIKNLHSSADSTEPLVFPTTRYNPFIE